MPSRLSHVRIWKCCEVVLLPHEDSFTKTFDGSREGKIRSSALNFPLYSRRGGQSEVGSPRSHDSGGVLNYSRRTLPPPLPRFPALKRELVSSVRAPLRCRAPTLTERGAGDHAGNAGTTADLSTHGGEEGGRDGGDRIASGLPNRVKTLKFHTNIPDSVSATGTCQIDVQRPTSSAPSSGQWQIYKLRGKRKQPATLRSTCRSVSSSELRLPSPTCPTRNDFAGDPSDYSEGVGAAAVPRTWRTEEKNPPLLPSAPPQRPPWTVTVKQFKREPPTSTVKYQFAPSTITGFLSALSCSQGSRGG